MGIAGRTALFAAALVCGCDCVGFRSSMGFGDGGPPDSSPNECVDDPYAEGCPCAPPDSAQCFTGPPESRDVGECRPGMRTCEEGLWGPCEGEQLPSDEVCNGADDDCDGDVDEEVTNECDECGECSEIEYGHQEGQIPFDPDEQNSSGVGLREPGAIVLVGDRITLHGVWAPNTAEGTVSKVDTWSRTEVARYRTGPNAEEDSPSRTSVDYQGHAYVANRAFGGQASVTKILEHDCTDRNGDGRLETSADRTDVLPWGEDECIAWNQPVGSRNAIARAVVVHTRFVDGEIREFVWVGLYNEHRFVELDARTGEPTGVTVDCTPCTPYGAAIDRDGQIWAACFSSSLCRFDTAEPEDVEVLTEPAVNYGITVDDDGRVWTGGTVSSYDPRRRTWTIVPDLVNALGMASDGHYIWVGGDTTIRLDAETLETREIAVDSNRGVGVDFEGTIWTIPMSGEVHVIDPDTLEATPVLRDCDGPNTTCLNAPYVYSDLTGFQLHQATSPAGTWETLVEGCGEGMQTQWIRLRWEIDAPVGTSVRIEVRGADLFGGLDRRPWRVAAVVPRDEPPVDLGSFLGEDAGAPALGLRVVLGSSSVELTPAVHMLAVQRNCS